MKDIEKLTKLKTYLQNNSQLFGFKKTLVEKEVLDGTLDDMKVHLWEDSNMYSWIDYLGYRISWDKTEISVQGTELSGFIFDDWLKEVKQFLKHHNDNQLVTK